MPPPTAGLAFKPQHFDEAMAASADGLWFEVHAENYMVDGGPRFTMLEMLRARHPLSIHGVGLSLGGHERPSPTHLSALSNLVSRFDPFLVSEHLAWSRIGHRCLPDLLPVPRTAEALACTIRNIDIVQHCLGRQLLLENPAHYLALDAMCDEPEFLTEIVARTGCKLLIDVNNVAVSANNLGHDAFDYLAALPLAAIGEIHIAGYSADPTLGEALLIDSHDTQVSEIVWALLAALLRLTGPCPVLLERDGNVPEFCQLMVERERAAAMFLGKEKINV